MTKKEYGLPRQRALLRDAKGGNPQAMLELAALLLKGTYATVADSDDTVIRYLQNPQLAFRLIAAAAVSSPAARFLLARAYFQGIGVSRSFEAGETWLRRVPFDRIPVESLNLAQATVFGNVDDTLVHTAQQLRLLA